jgi:aspartyl-tRNA(Asn)/glutamyl-tRNA(Gln) amidotransferase subunit B
VDEAANTTLGYIKAIDRNAGLKADVNISLPELNGARVEIKNINSLKNIQQAIEYEIQRQKKEIPKVQETRMFDEASGVTKKMREKEQAEDYRFIAEPDLPVIKIETSKINLIKKNLPETPLEKLKKLIKKYNIDKKTAIILIRKLEIVEFFEEVAEKTNSKLALSWIVGELLSVLNYNKKELNETNITPEAFVGLLKNVKDGVVTELNAKDILRSWIKETPSAYNLSLKDYMKITDDIELEKFCKEVIKETPQAIKDYKSGKKESLNFLIGKVMQKTKKRADFKTTREILEKLLKDF